MSRQEANEKYIKRRRKKEKKGKLLKYMLM